MNHFNQLFIAIEVLILMGILVIGIELFDNSICLIIGLMMLVVLFSRACNNVINLDNGSDK